MVLVFITIHRFGVFVLFEEGIFHMRIEEGASWRCTRRYRHKNHFKGNDTELSYGFILFALLGLLHHCARS